MTRLLLAAAAVAAFAPLATGTSSAATPSCTYHVWGPTIYSYGLPDFWVSGNAGADARCATTVAGCSIVVTGPSVLVEDEPFYAGSTLPSWDSPCL